jgi:chromate reductase
LQVAAADGVLFACPEYNGSVSGVLKNALDWASRSPNVWDGKPAALMGAGGGGGTAKAQTHLREIGLVLNLHVLNKSVQVQAFAPGNCDLATGELLSPELRKRVADLVAALAQWVDRLAPK